MLARALREEEERRLRRLRTMGEMVRSPAAREIARAQALANAEDRRLRCKFPEVCDVVDLPGADEGD